MNSRLKVVILEPRKSNKISSITEQTTRTDQKGSKGTAGTPSGEKLVLKRGHLDL